MGDVINQIWEFVGGVSAITGLACFPHGSTYSISLGKLGYVGPPVYLFVCSFIWWLMSWNKGEGEGNQVSVKFKGVVGGILFVVLCSISAVYEKYGPKKSDAYTIASFGLFALMAMSLSSNLKLGFQTGFSVFFLQLFLMQLFKIKWFLLLIAIAFCCLVIVLRHCPESIVPRARVGP